jgi:di/tricarboxylate transporter
VVRADAKPNQRLNSKEAASYVFASMWTPVIMLLIGGFTIAAALSKFNIAKMMATFVLSKAGTKPRTVLLTSMAVALFASMWISNVAAPVLCFSIIQVSRAIVSVYFSAESGSLTMKCSRFFATCRQTAIWPKHYFSVLHSHQTSVAQRPLSLRRRT